MSNELNEAFEQVVRQEARRLYALCYRLTGNAPEAEDLCQEAFSRALRAFHHFEGRSQVGTWLYRIALNAWKNRLRSRRLRTFVSFFSLSSDGEEPRELDVVGPDRAPEAELESVERSRLVQEALLKLDADDRAIVVLRDLDDKSYDDISKFLDIPVGTVKSRLSRARERLRDLLDPAVTPPRGSL